MAPNHDEKAVVIICLGLNPYSLDKTLQSLMVCSGVLDYFRAIHGRGYIMTINFSGTRLLQAKTPEMAEACLREECYDWAGVLERAEQRMGKDTPEQCRHCELVFVGTDEVPKKIRDVPGVCQRLRLNGIRINSIVVEPTLGKEEGSGPVPMRGWTMLTPSREYHHPDDSDEEDSEWNMVRIARATGGLTLEPNTEGKLAVHQLFGEMFRRWGEDYWKSASNSKKIGARQ